MLLNNVKPMKNTCFHTLLHIYTELCFTQFNNGPECVKKALNALNSAFSETITQPPNHDAGAEGATKCHM